MNAKVIYNKKKCTEVIWSVFGILGINLVCKIPTIKIYYIHVSQILQLQLQFMSTKQNTSRATQ